VNTFGLETVKERDTAEDSGPLERLKEITRK
jgi:hypothetical protein